VDEAGMAGTRKLARLLDHAERWGAAVVLVGDPRQLPEVAAGGAFSALAKALPMTELKENRRQSEVWEKQALSQLRSGSVSEAIDAYERSGRITLANSAQAAREAMVERWWESRQRGEEAMMYALRRSDVEDLNARARTRLDASGALGDDRIEVAGRQFAVGDRVMCLRNDRRLGASNGTIGTVVAVGKATGDMTLSDGTHLPSSYLEAGHVGYALASTVHKAQGATVDRAFLLGSDQLYREAGYVGLSRGRLSNELFVVAADRDEGLDDLVRPLSTSRAQALAVNQLGGAPGQDRATGRALLADPPAWACQTLGDPPLSGPDRRRWAERASVLASYRDSYGVTDDADAVGPRPADPMQRRRWELAQLAVLENQRSLEVERGLAR
jgi:ATP-dependent exoDNAse (exonuclease V) alpha subunit